MCLSQNQPVSNPKSDPNLPFASLSQGQGLPSVKFLRPENSHSWPSFSLTLMSSFSPSPLKLTLKILKSPTFQPFIDLILSQDIIVFFLDHSRGLYLSSLLLHLPPPLTLIQSPHSRERLGHLLTPNSSGSPFVLWIIQIVCCKQPIPPCVAQLTSPASSSAVLPSVPCALTTMLFFYIHR